MKKNTEKQVKFISFRKTGEIIDKSPVFKSIIEGFEKECRKCSIEVQIISLNQKNKDFTLQMQKLKKEIHSGIVILGTEMEEDDITYFTDCQCPILLLDYWDEQMRINSIVVYNELGVSNVVKELIENGHTEIGYLRGKNRIKNFREREEGFLKELAKNNIPFEKDYVWDLSVSIEEAYQETIQYIKNKGKFPTAFFADNDMIALGAMKAFQKSGIKVPEDISIVGFDDLPYCKFSQPNLCSLQIPQTRMGIMAARIINQMMLGEWEMTAKFTVVPELMRRESIMKK